MENSGPYREKPEEPKKTKAEWEKHPAYIADGGGLFGAPPQLKCQYCGKTDYELFYGHCKECANTKGIPQETATPEEFHSAMNSGTNIIIKGLPKDFGKQKQYPWWHWRRWFSKKQAR